MVSLSYCCSASGQEAESTTGEQGEKEKKKEAGISLGDRLRVVNVKIQLFISYARGEKWKT